MFQLKMWKKVSNLFEKAILRIFFKKWIRIVLMNNKFALLKWLNRFVFAYALIQFGKRMNLIAFFFNFVFLCFGIIVSCIWFRSPSFTKIPKPVFFDVFVSWFRIVFLITVFFLRRSFQYSSQFSRTRALSQKPYFFLLCCS